MKRFIITHKEKKSRLVNSLVQSLSLKTKILPIFLLSPPSLHGGNMAATLPGVTSSAAGQQKKHCGTISCRQFFSSVSFLMRHPLTSHWPEPYHLCLPKAITGKGNYISIPGLDYFSSIKNIEHPHAKRCLLLTEKTNTNKPKDKYYVKLRNIQTVI